MVKWSVCFSVTGNHTYCRLEVHLFPACLFTHLADDHHHVMNHNNSWRLIYVIPFYITVIKLYSDQEVEGGLNRELWMYGIVE